jgi:hypothetical protein
LPKNTAVALSPIWRKREGCRAMTTGTIIDIVGAGPGRCADTADPGRDRRIIPDLIPGPAFPVRGTGRFLRQIMAGSGGPR